MKKRIFIFGVSFIMLFALCFTSFYSSAQEESDQANTTWVPEKPKSKFNWNRVIIGGGLGLQFGNVTFVDISPLVGYRITDQFHAGFGITYQYMNFNDPRYRKFETNVYGGRIFGRYLFTEYFFAHSEIELLNLEAFDFNRRRVTVTGIFIGGGYIQPIGGGHSYLMLMLLYNINESVYSPYRNPIMRMGINIGL